jgi:hypothetical protein
LTINCWLLDIILNTATFFKRGSKMVTFSSNSMFNGQLHIRWCHIRPRKLFLWMTFHQSVTIFSWFVLSSLNFSSNCQNGRKTAQHLRRDEQVHWHHVQSLEEWRAIFLRLFWPACFSFSYVNFLTNYAFKTVVKKWLRTNNCLEKPFK